MRRKSRSGQYISLRAAEQEFGLPYHRLWRWAREGKLPTLSSDLAGRAIYVKRKDLEGLLAEHTSEVRS